MYARVALGMLAVAAASCGSGGSRDEVPSAIASADDSRGTYVVGSCAHDPCVTGAKLPSSCDACVGSVCAKDSYCCTTGWDQQCVNEAGMVCGKSCGGGGGGGGGGGSCAHDVCATGTKLTSGCSSCA